MHVYAATALGSEPAIEPVMSIVLVLMRIHKGIEPALNALAPPVLNLLRVHRALRVRLIDSPPTSFAKQGFAVADVKLTTDGSVGSV